MLLTIAPFRRYGKNRHITSNISDYPGPNLTYFTGLVDVFVCMIISMFVWQSPKGYCYGNQLNLEDGHRHRQERPFFSLWRSTTDWPIVKSAFKRLNGDIRATSCANLVNFRQIIWEFTLLKRVIFAAIRPQFNDDLHSLRHRSKTDCKITILILAE